jgi:hypothetical protein
LDPFIARRRTGGHGVSFLGLADYTGLVLISPFIEPEKNLWSTRTDYDKIKNRENVIESARKYCPEACSGIGSIRY